jgi:hypothetical protein
MRLVESYRPPQGDPDGAYVRGRCWTYDAALVAAARTVQGELDGGAALLDRLQALQVRDRALAQSYDIARERGDGEPRSGVMAWAGLAALAWRRVTGSDRHAALIAGVARWLLEQRHEDRAAPGYGLIRGGAGVSWTAAEHNLEARAFFAGLAALGEPGGAAARPAARLAEEARAAVADLDVAIERDLLVDADRAGAHLRQGLGDDARALDVQALGTLWLAGRRRADVAERVAAEADRAMLVRGRVPAWPGAEGATFSGYRPYAGARVPDVLWMEGTLQMRTAKARIGADTRELDDSIERWVALTGPGYFLQADGATGDYHVWPAVAPAAWLTLSRAGFPLLSA